MKHNEDLYMKLVEKTLHKYIEGKSIEVNNLRSIKVLPYDVVTYKEIIRLLNEHNIEALKSLDADLNSKNEYIDVMVFEGQPGKEYAITVYDADYLWQDPEIFDIVPL